MVKKGLMLSNVLPQMEHDADLFVWGIEKIQKYDLQAIEFYSEAKLAKQYGERIRDVGWEVIFHSALDQKRSGWCRICAENENERRKSVDFTKRSLETAISAGASRAVLQSGRYPENPAMEGVCLDMLEKSVHELLDFVGNRLQLSIEPCDRSIEIRQLIGPAMTSYGFMQRIKADNLSLTLDTAHIALTFEPVIETVRLCKPFCSHIHLANCYIDPNHPMFGDKHPLFGVEGGAFSDEEGKALLSEIEALYAGDLLYISPEMICREEDQKAYFSKFLTSVSWFL